MSLSPVYPKSCKKRLLAFFLYSILPAFMLHWSACITSAQTHPSLEAREKREIVKKGTEETHSSLSSPSSYGEAYASSQFWEYIGSFDFTVDEENAEVEIRIIVIITTGEENEYGDGEFINVWIDWEGDGEFGGNDQVMDQIQFARAVGFKGALYYTTRVPYPEDLMIADETWIRASLGYGYDPAASDSWMYGSSMTKPIKLGESELNKLRVWVAPLAPSLKSASISSENNMAGKDYYTGTLPDGSVIDPYHGYLVQNNWVYGDKFKPLVYYANEPWSGGTKWKGKGLFYEFTAKFPGEKLRIIVRLMKSTGESGEEDDTELWSTKPSLEIKNGKNRGAIPGEEVMNLLPGHYYLKWEREVPLPPSEGLSGLWKTITDAWHGYGISLKFNFEIQRRPFYICDKEICKPEIKQTDRGPQPFAEEHINIPGWKAALYNHGTNLAGSGTSTALGAIITGTVAFFATTPIGWVAAGLIGIGSSFTVGYVGSELPNAFGWQGGDLAREYKWELDKYKWNGSTYIPAGIKLTWHLLDYYRRGADIGFGYYWDSNLGNFPSSNTGGNYLDYGSWNDVGYIWKNTVPDYKAWTELWHYNCYPAIEYSSVPNAPHASDNGGYGPIAPRLDRPKPGDPTNHIPMWRKNETTGQYFTIDYRGSNEYTIHSLAMDPDGIGIYNTEWTAPEGTITHSGKDFADWKSPGDGKPYYWIKAKVEADKLKGQPNASSTKYAIIHSPTNKKSGSTVKSWSVSGFSANSFIENIRETVVDTDNNGKHDSLIFQFEMDVSAVDTSGEITSYSLSALLSDESGNFITAGEIYFPGNDGRQTLSMPICGTKINSVQRNGPYKLYGFMLEKISVLETQQIAFDLTSYLTASYKASDFEGLYFGFTDGYSDSGIDENNDGLFDALQFTIPVFFEKPGMYGLQGQLYNTDSILLGSSMVRVEKEQPGDTVLSLLFEGKRIFESNVDGIYELRDLSLTDYANPGVFCQSGILFSSTYHSTDFEKPFISALQVLSDNGEDTNNDALYDSLIISCNMQVETAGHYLISASLVHSDTVYISSVQKYIYSNSGNQDFHLAFPGREISASLMNGPYTISSIVITNESDERVVSDEAYVTGSYEYFAFQQPGLTLSDSYSESTEDADADNRIDYLLITMGLEIISGGVYDITGILQDQEGNTVATAFTEEMMVKGPETVVLSFSGQDIATSGKDGPYIFSVTAWDTLNNLILASDNVFNTSGFSTTQFEAPFAAFTNQYVELTPDIDLDGYYDSLEVDIGLSVNEQGDYLIRAEMIDSTLQIIQETERMASLSAGTQSVRLNFDGKEFFKNGVDGPYLLGNLYLYRIDGETWSTLEMIDLAYASGEYQASEFQHTAAYLAGEFDDYGQDLNENGLLDVLVVETGIFVEESGSYRLEGQLYDNNGYYIETASVETYLEVGLDTLSFSFSGGRIRGHGEASPYHLKYTRIFDSWNQLLQSVDEAYTTQHYQWDQFEISEADLTTFTTELVLKEGIPGDQTVTIQTMVFNFGGTPVDSVMVSFYNWELDLYELKPVYNITGGAPGIVELDLTIPPDNYTYSISVTIDPLDSIPEMNELNNTSAISITVPLPDFPEPPSLVKTVSNPDSVSLSWSAATGSVSGYNLYRRLKGESEFQRVNTSLIDQTFYLDTTVQEDTVYYYRVTSYLVSAPSLEGAYSMEVMAQTREIILELSLHEYHVNKEDTFELPIRISDLKGTSVYSIDLVISVDPDILRCNEVVLSGTVAADWSEFSYQCLPDGEVWIQMEGETPLSDTGGTIVIIHYDITGEIGDTCQIQILNCVLNEGYPEIHTSTGSLIVQSSVEVPSKPLDSGDKLRNYPNPFSHSTIIEYACPSLVIGDEVIVEVFNLNMIKVCMMQSVVINPGKHRIEWDGCDQNGTPLPGGIYIYTVRAGESYQYGRMMILK